MTEACKWQYGVSSAKARFTDIHDAFSWVCYSA